jgi:hypothetical protein
MFVDERDDESEGLVVYGAGEIIAGLVVVNVQAIS